MYLLLIIRPMKLPRHPSPPRHHRSHPICCTCVSRSSEREHLLSSLLFFPPEISSNVRPVIFCRRRRRGATIQAVSERVTRQQHRRDGLPPPLKAHNHGQRTTDRFVAVGWLDAKIGQLADQKGAEMGRESPLISPPSPPLRQDAICRSGGQSPNHSVLEALVGFQRIWDGF